MEKDLQDLHCLLKELRALKLQGQGKCDEWYSQSVWSVMKMDAGVLVSLSSNLYEELARQFENFPTFPSRHMDGTVGLYPETQFSKEGFILLLKCCLALLEFLEFDMSLIWEKSSVLVKILIKVCAPDFLLDTNEHIAKSRRSSDSHHCSGSLGVCEETDDLASLYSSILEVFIAELSENPDLRDHFVAVDVINTDFENSHANVNAAAHNFTVLELACSHFLLSISNDLAYRRFHLSFYGSEVADKIIPQLSLNSCLTLISSNFMLSAPQMFQAHLILLASRCIRTQLPAAEKSDTLLMNHHISIFEVSANLYLSSLSNLRLDDSISGVNGRSNMSDIITTFDSCVPKLVLDKLTHQANELFDFCELHSENVSNNPFEVVDDATTYIKESHPLIDQLCKDATCFILNYLMKSILPRKMQEQGQGNTESFGQEVYLLAAAMNLTNCSLLQILFLLRQSGHHDEMETSKEFSACKPYEFLFPSTIVSRFSESGADKLVKSFLCDIIRDGTGVHQEIKFLLAHFSSLLFFSFRRKLVLLWKGCISMILTLMNLLLLFDKREVELSKVFNLSQGPYDIDKGLTYKRSSVETATNLNKARFLCVNAHTKYMSVDGNRIDFGQGTEVDGQEQSSTGVECNNGNTCNGKRFIECIPEYHTNPAEWGDLVDFIECRPGKDYISWLKKRHKYNKWKQERTVTIKHRKRKKQIPSIKKVYDLRAR